MPLNSNKLNIEQKHILEGWFSYYLDASISKKSRGEKIYALLIEEHLKKYLPKDFLSVREKKIENVLSEKGNLYKFDILIVKKNVGEKEIYAPGEVFSAIEVKGYGIFGKKEEIENNIKHLSVFKIKKKYPHIKCAYLAIQERMKTRNPNSINYYELCKKIWGDSFFCLTSEIRNNKNLSGIIDDRMLFGEWERLISFLFS